MAPEERAKKDAEISRALDDIQAEIDNAGVNPGEGSSMARSLPFLLHLAREVTRKKKAIVLWPTITAADFSSENRKKKKKKRRKQNPEEQGGNYKMLVISEMTPEERAKKEAEALARGPGLKGKGIGCNRCRWLKNGCLACNPEKLEAYEQRVALGITRTAGGARGPRGPDPRIPLDENGFRVCDKCGFKVQWAVSPRKGERKSF